MKRNNPNIKRPYSTGSYSHDEPAKIIQVVCVGELEFFQCQVNARSEYNQVSKVGARRVSKVYHSHDKEIDDQCGSDSQTIIFRNAVWVREKAHISNVLVHSKFTFLSPFPTISAP
jgi:hypothetical protein